MECLNRIELIGYVTETARVSETSGGVKFAQFKLMTRDVYVPARGGESKERIDYHYIVCYGGLANMATSLANGEKVFIEGKQEHWYNKDEQNKETKSSPVVCRTMVKMSHGSRNKEG